MQVPGSGPAWASLLNTESGSSDTSLILKCFEFGDRVSSVSSEFDWSVFDDDCAASATSTFGGISCVGGAANAAEGLVASMANTAARDDFTPRRGSSRRSHGYRVRRSRFDAWRLSCELCEEGSSWGPPGFDASLGFSLVEWEKVYPKLVGSGIVIKDEPAD